MNVQLVNGEDLDALYQALRNCVVFQGPCAVVIKRKMMPGVAGMEGKIHGHDCIPTDKVPYPTFRYRVSILFNAKIGDLKSSERWMFSFFVCANKFVKKFPFCFNNFY